MEGVFEFNLFIRKRLESIHLFKELIGGLNLKEFFHSISPKNKKAATRVCWYRPFELNVHLLSKHGRYDRFQSCPDGRLPCPPHPRPLPSEEKGRVRGELGKRLGDSICLIFNRFFRRSQERGKLRHMPLAGLSEMMAINGQCDGQRERPGPANKCPQEELPVLNPLLTHNTEAKNRTNESVDVDRDMSEVEPDFNLRRFIFS